jgi:hypothetical protein
LTCECTAPASVEPIDANHGRGPLTCKIDDEPKGGYRLFNSIFFALAMIANVIAAQKGTQAQLQQLATTQITQRLEQLNSTRASWDRGRCAPGT